MVLPILLVAAPHARAEIRTEVVRAAPGKPFLAAVEIDTDPHWHIYWRNPGDSGIPTQIDWSVPPGWRVEPLEFPTPRRFAPGGVAAYGYEGRTLFLARITPTKTPGRLAARVKWLVCANACVAGGAALVVEVPLGTSETGPWEPTLRAARQSLPGPLTAWATATATATPGKAVTLVATFAPDAIAPFWREAEFFPAVSGVVDQSKPLRATLRKGTLVFKMDASPFPERRDHLPGLIVFSAPGRRQAVSVDPRLEREAKP